MADRVIDLLIKVKHDGGRELNELAKGLMKTAGVATAAFTKLAWDAAPLEGVTQAFRGIAESSGESADAMLAALEKGSAGMVRQRDLMLTYNNAAQLVSKQFANQLPQAMQYLGKVSLATGQDMGFLLDSLVKGVGRLSPAILDNLAIQVNLASATERASQMFGVQAEELTKAQVQAGMMNVVMEKLAENTAAMPDVMGSAAQQTAQFSATLADIKDKAGMMALPALKAVLSVVNDLNDDTVALALGLGGAAAAMVKFSGGLDGLARNLGTTTMGLGAMAAAITATVAAWEVYQDTEKKVRQANQEFEDALEEAGKDIKESADLALYFADAAKETREATSGVASIFVAWSDILFSTASREEMVADITETLNTRAVEAAKTYKEYTNIIDRYNAEVNDAKLTTKAMTEEQWLHERALTLDAEAAYAAADAMVRLQEEHALAEEAAQEMALGVAEADAGMLRYAERVALTGGTINLQALAIRQYNAEVAAMRAAQEEIGAKIMAVGGIATSAIGSFVAAQQEAAAAQAAHQKAVADTALSYTNLAASLKDATDAQIANTLIGMLDPEEMGAAAFTSAVTEIGTAFGTMDEESIALAGSLGELANAIERGVVPAQNADEALAALIADAEDGEVKVNDLIRQFDRVPEPTNAATLSVEDLGVKIEDMMAAGDPAIETMAALAAQVGDVAGPTSTAAQEVAGLEQKLTSLAKEYTVTVRINTVGALPGGAVPSFQMGLWRVPYDNMMARLHLGEMVVPRAAAEMLRGERRGPARSEGGDITVFGPLVGSATIRDERDVQLLAELVADELAARTRGRGAVR